MAKQPTPQEQLKAIAEENKEDIISLRSGKDLKDERIVSTGSFWFDYVLGGGFRSSSWSRFYADPECGKTSMGLCWAKNWQDEFGDDAFVIIHNAEGRITKALIDRSG